MRLKKPGHHAGLPGGIADDHGSDGPVILHHAGFAEVGDDVVQHRLHELFEGIKELPVAADLEHGDFLKNLGHPHPVLGFDGFPHEAQGVAVGDGLVVVVFVEVIAEKSFGRSGLPDQRRAGEADLDSLRIRFGEIGEETALGIITTVDLIRKIDALESGTAVP